MLRLDNLLYPSVTVLSVCTVKSLVSVQVDSVDVGWNHELPLGRAKQYKVATLLYYDTLVY